MERHARRNRLGGLSRSDMEHLLEGFLRLVQIEIGSPANDPYDVSAKYLLGSSKIWQSLGKALSPQGISNSSIWTRPRHSWAPARRTKVYPAVENPESFERLSARTGRPPSTVIATYGTHNLVWSGVEGRLDRIKIARVAGTLPPTLAEDGCGRHLFLLGRPRPGRSRHIHQAARAYPTSLFERPLRSDAGCRRGRCHKPSVLSLVTSLGRSRQSATTMPSIAWLLRADSERSIRNTFPTPISLRSPSGFWKNRENDAADIVLQALELTVPVGSRPPTRTSPAKLGKCRLGRPVDPDGPQAASDQPVGVGVS